MKGQKLGTQFRPHLYVSEETDVRVTGFVLLGKHSYSFIAYVQVLSDGTIYKDSVYCNSYDAVPFSEIFNETDCERVRETAKAIAAG